MPDVLLISSIVWNKLPPDIREILQESADESCVFERKLWKDMSSESMKAVERAGVEIIRPDKKLFRNSVRDMHAQYAGTEIGILMEGIAAAE